MTAGAYTITLRAASTEYSSAAIANVDTTFTVTVGSPCDARAFTVPASAISAVSFTVTGSSSPVTRTVSAFDQGSCKYTETLAISPDPTDAAYPWATWDAGSRTMTIDSTDTALAYVSQEFTVTSTINDAYSSSASHYTFTVTMLNNVCLTTQTLTAPTLSEAGTPTITVEDFNVDETVTFSDAGDSSGGTLCGPRAFAAVTAADTAVAVDWVTFVSTGGSGYKIRANP